MRAGWSWLPVVALSSGLALVWSGAPAQGAAATPAPAKPVVPAQPRAASKRVPPAKAVVKLAVAPASAEQLDAAARVYFGAHQCALGQAIDVALDPRHAGYVDVRVGKATHVMKPVLSSTGAVRLEDVRGVMLMVQITSKSMLMDVKSGRRVADECVSDKHREAIQATVGAPAAQSLMSPPAEAPPSVPSSTSPNVPEPPPPGPSPAPDR